MSVLFLMPNWKTPSEVFLQRMLDGLAGNLGCVVSWHTNGEMFWRNEVPAVSLAVPLWTVAEKILIRLKLSPQEMPVDEVLLRAIRNYRISKVLCHYAEFALRFEKVWEQTDVPVFVHFHGYDATFDLRSHDTPDIPFHRKDYIEQLVRFSRRATFIANSIFTRDKLIAAGIPRERIIMKYLGVPIPQKHKRQQGTSNVTILHVGRLVDFKSPDRTIRAFELACDKGLHAELVIAGDGPMRITCELLRVRSPYRDKIKILGAVDVETVSRLLREADLFTQHNIKGELSCQEECFGVSIVEAMAAGLPVVGTKSGAVSETVVHAETGLLGEPGDVEEQAANFLRLAGDASLRAKLGAAGRQRVEAHFSVADEHAALRSILDM